MSSDLNQIFYKYYNKKYLALRCEAISLDSKKGVLKGLGSLDKKILLEAIKRSYDYKCREVEKRLLEIFNTTEDYGIKSSAALALAIYNNLSVLPFLLEYIASSEKPELILKAIGKLNISYPSYIMLKRQCRTYLPANFKELEKKLSKHPYGRTVLFYLLQTIRNLVDNNTYSIDEIKSILEKLNSLNDPSVILSKIILISFPELKHDILNGTYDRIFEYAEDPNKSKVYNQTMHELIYILTTTRFYTESDGDAITTINSLMKSILMFKSYHTHGYQYARDPRGDIKTIKYFININKGNLKKVISSHLFKSLFKDYFPCRLIAAAYLALKDYPAAIYDLLNLFRNGKRLLSGDNLFEDNLVKDLFEIGTIFTDFIPVLVKLLSLTTDGKYDDETFVHLVHKLLTRAKMSVLDPENYQSEVVTLLIDIINNKYRSLYEIERALWEMDERILMKSLSLSDLEKDPNMEEHEWHFFVDTFSHIIASTSIKASEFRPSTQLRKKYEEMLNETKNYVIQAYQGKHASFKYGTEEYSSDPWAQDETVTLSVNPQEMAQLRQRANVIFGHVLSIVKQSAKAEQSLFSYRRFLTLSEQIQQLLRSMPKVKYEGGMTSGQRRALKLKTIDWDIHKELVRLNKERDALLKDPMVRLLYNLNRYSQNFIHMINIKTLSVLIHQLESLGFTQFSSFLTQEIMPILKLLEEKRKTATVEDTSHWYHILRAIGMSPNRTCMNSILGQFADNTPSYLFDYHKKVVVVTNNADGIIAKTAIYKIDVTLDHGSTIHALVPNFPHGGIQYKRILLQHMLRMSFRTGLPLMIQTDFFSQDDVEKAAQELRNSSEFSINIFQVEGIPVFPESKGIFHHKDRFNEPGNLPFLLVEPSVKQQREILQAKQAN